MHWLKADKLSISGAVFTGIGGCLALCSIIPFCSNVQVQPNGNINPILKNTVAGVCLVTAGGISACIGVGLLFGASAQYNKAIDIYNSKYDHAAVQLKWHVAPTEAGLALVF